MDSEQIEKGELKNGFQYCIRQLSYFKNFVVMALVVRTGSISEHDYEKGISHLMEHISMSFCSFDLLPEINYQTKAYTDYNETIFYIKCASDIVTVKKCLNIYKNIATGKYLKQQYFKYAQKDVLEEIEAKRTEKKILIDLLLKGSNYLEHLAIGNAEVICEMSLQNVIKFYENNYSADNMILIMVGDIQKYNNLKEYIQTTYVGMRCNHKEKIYQKFTIPKYMPQYFIERKEKNNFTIEIDIYFRIEKHRENFENEIKREIIEKIIMQIILENFETYLDKEKMVEEIKFNHMDLDMFYMFYIVKVEIQDNGNIALEKIMKDIDNYPSYLLNYIKDVDITSKKEQFYYIIKDEESYYEKMGIQQLLMECIDHYILDKKIYTYEEKRKLYETLSREIEGKDMYDFLEEICDCPKFFYIKE